MIWKGKYNRKIFTYKFLPLNTVITLSQTFFMDFVIKIYWLTILWQRRDNQLQKSFLTFLHFYICEIFEKLVKLVS